MQIRNQRIFVLGGAGLVGMAVCRAVLTEQPAALFVAALDAPAAQEAVAVLQRDYPEAVIEPIWGNIFVRSALKDAPPSEWSATARAGVLQDVYAPLSAEITRNNTLYQLIQRTQPDAIIDCINTATAFAYQNSYQSAEQLLASADTTSATLLNGISDHLGRSALPQLVRHIQILLEACRQTVQVYVKVGTSGTGGMGLNIPFTHGEEKPSRMLLAKSAVAGAHTQLLFLLARTPDAPIVKEVKPTTAIAWKRITHDTVLRGGKPVALYDAPTTGYPLAQALARHGDFGVRCGGNLKAALIDTGENGVFSAEEFTAITTLGLMQFITPEEIAHAVLLEMKGSNTGNDVIAGLDATVMGPTYRAGLMRQQATARLAQLQRQHGNSVAAFEILGPPRLSKLLYEGEILVQATASHDQLLALSAADLSQCAYRVVRENAALRRAAISIGIPILSPDGDCLLRGPVIKADSAETGWIDLQPDNMAQWQRWIGAMRQEAVRDSCLAQSRTSSRFNRRFNETHDWTLPPHFNVGEMAAWILRHHDNGRRWKD